MRHRQQQAVLIHHPWGQAHTSGLERVEVSCKMVPLARHLAVIRVEEAMDSVRSVFPVRQSARGFRLNLPLHESVMRWIGHPLVLNTGPLARITPTRSRTRIQDSATRPWASMTRRLILNLVHSGIKYRQHPQIRHKGFETLSSPSYGRVPKRRRTAFSIPHVGHSTWVVVLSETTRASFSRTPHSMRLDPKTTLEMGCRI